MKSLALYTLLCLIAADALRAQPAEDKIERKDGHRVWKLTSYLQGTADEIRKELNGPVDHLLETRKKQTDRIARLDEEIAAGRQHGENILLADEQYVRLAKALKDADAAKEAARKTGTSQQRLDAGAAYVKAKAAADQMRKKFVDEDANVIQLGKERVEAKQQLREIEVSIGRAEEWRRELVDAIHGSMLFQWPMKRGQVGILGPVVPRRATGNDSFETNFTAGELVNTEGTHEGITSVQQIAHPVRVLVSGVDVPWEPGKPVSLNRAYQVAGGADDGGRGLIMVHRVHEEVDELLDAVAKGPEVPADDMDRMLKLAEQKENPKKWDSLVAMMTAIPAGIRPRTGEKLSADRVKKIDEWIGKEMTGDRVDLTLTLQGVRLTDNGAHVYSTGDAPGLRSATFTLICSEAMQLKAERVKAGQPARVIGVIKSIHLNPDGSLEARLVDASF